MSLLCKVRSRKSSPGPICPHCCQSLVDHEQTLNNREFLKTVSSQQKELIQLKTKLNELQPRLDFLRFQFNSGQSEENPRSDVVIFVKDETDKPLYAHKTVLMLEEETGVVRIEDATLPVIRAVIKFCYDAENIDFTEEVTAEDVLAVAHKYAIDLLEKTCEKHLSETIDDGNLPKRLKLAKKFEIKGLKTTALQYLKAEFRRGN